MLQGMILAALVYFHKKSDRSVNKFLALYIAVLSFVMMSPLLLQVITWQKSSLFMEPVPLLIGPFLYFYLRSFKETITWRKAWPHFVMAFVYLFVSYWSFQPYRLKYPDMEEVPADMLQDPFIVVRSLLKQIQLLVYYFLARRTLLSYQRSIRHLFSETSRIDLQWARWLINGYIFLVLASLVLYALMVKYPDYFTILFTLMMALATPYIYVVTYKGILQPTIWQVKPDLKKETVEQEIHEAEEAEISKPVVRTVKPGQEDRVDEIIARIIGVMEKEKLYQETELTLQGLSDKLQFPSYQVSQAINDGMKKNFYDLINGYRVEEAKRLLLDPGNRNYTILSVGFEAGFNSKTTFNTVFKKFTGLTPTDYRQKQRAMQPADTKNHI
jgi:AraC-like DNA-binding protein